MYQFYQKDQDQIRDATYISDVVFISIFEVLLSWPKKFHLASQLFLAEDYDNEEKVAEDGDDRVDSPHMDEDPLWAAVGGRHLVRFPDYHPKVK